MQKENQKLTQENLGVLLHLNVQWPNLDRQRRE